MKRLTKLSTDTHRFCSYYTLLILLGITKYFHLFSESIHVLKVTSLTPHEAFEAKLQATLLCSPSLHSNQSSPMVQVALQVARL